MNPLKIVIADDNKRMVDVIKEVINGEPQLDVVGTATNGEDTVDVIKKTQPDIVLLDIIMPQIDGLTVMQRIRRIMIVLILHLLLLVQLEGKQ